MDKAAVITTYSASATAAATSAAAAAPAFTINHWIGVASLLVAVFTAGFNVWWKLKTMNKAPDCECKSK